jgi:hypothetical protein
VCGLSRERAQFRIVLANREQVPLQNHHAIGTIGHAGLAIFLRSRPIWTA